MSEELHIFLRKHKNAWQFANKAWEDYLFVRCGLLHEFFSALEVAAQTIEKLLKSYLCFKVKEYDDNFKVLCKKLIKQKKLIENDKFYVEICCINEDKLDKIFVKDKLIQLFYVQGDDKKYCKTKWYIIGVNKYGAEIKGYLNELTEHEFLRLAYGMLPTYQPSIQEMSQELLNNLEANKRLKPTLLLGFEQYISEVNATHDVFELYKLAKEHELALPTRSQEFLYICPLFFDFRYHDKDVLSHKSTGWLVDIDHLIFDIWDNFKEISEEYYYTCGINTPVYSFIVGKKRPSNWYNFLTINNKAYACRRNEIETEAQRIFEKKCYRTP